MRLFLITGPAEHETNETLERACATRGVEVVGVSPESHRLGLDPEPGPGDALYRVLPGTGAVRLERALLGEGVLSFFTDRTGVHYGTSDQLPLFRIAGLPTPRSNPWPSADPALLAEQAAALGGPPWVLKVPGLWGGMGVIKVESLTGLRSVIGYLHAAGERPILMEWFPLVKAWRTVVVGDRVVDTNAKVPPPDGFRTNRTGSTDVPGPHVASERLADLSVRACLALGFHFGGVDLLEDAAGNLVLTEVNNPTYYARQERVTGFDISGAMIDWLLARASA